MNRLNQEKKAVKQLMNTYARGVSIVGVGRMAFGGSAPEGRREGLSRKISHRYPY
jgi:hypothetical protein